MSVTKKDFIDYNYNNYFISLLKECTGNSRLSESLSKKKSIKAEIDLLMNRKAELQQFSFSKTIQDNSSTFNSHRLDLIWSRNLIETIIMVANINLPSLNLYLQAIATTNGYLSYILYIVRGGTDVVNLLKHVFLPEANLQKFYDEKNISYWEKFTVQWGLRYSRIMNDIVLWAPVNSITFHLLYGEGALGIAGGFLTLLLLIGDFQMTRIAKQTHEQYFQKILKEVGEEADQGDLIKQHQKTMRNFDFVLNYQIALITSFACIVLASLCGSSGMPILLVASISCFISQIVINLKDEYLELNDEQDKEKINNLYLKISKRIFIQLAIPASVLVIGISLIPLLPTLPVVFLLAANTFIAMQLIQLTNNFNIQNIASTLLRLTALIGMGMALSAPPLLLIGILTALSSIAIDIGLNYCCSEGLLQP